MKIFHLFFVVYIGKFYSDFLWNETNFHVKQFALHYINFFKNKLFRIIETAMKTNDLDFDCEKKWKSMRKKKALEFDA